MLPQVMVVTNLAMVNVALPAIRETFNARADLMAWVVTSYTLSFVALMPLYGRLSDDLGIRRMLLLGVAIFMAGTILNTLAPSLPVLLLGRFIQGVGASGIVPLAIAMICKVFPAQTRGRALGQWNAIGPVASMASTLLGGIMIDTLGWHSGFLLSLLAGVVTAIMVRRAVPPPEHALDLAPLRDLDWAGVGLLSGGLAALLFYVTSRPITGREPLTDWRLLLVTVALLVAFVRREQRATVPFIDLTILRDVTFRRASLASAARMFVMSGTAFLNPLFLTDVKGLGATAIGLIIMARAAALWPTMILGGRLADRWGSRRPIVLGLGVMTGAILILALSGPGEGVVWVVTGLILNGLGAGVALPALHHAAMHDPEGDRGGAAAGLYSMIRFWGMMLGTALSGVLLQALLDQGATPALSYRWAYAATAIAGLAGVALGAVLRTTRDEGVDTAGGGT